MTHRAESVMSAIVTAVTGLTATGARVYRGRALPLGDAELPCLLVYMGQDEPQQIMSNQYLDSALSVRIEAVTKSPTAQLDTSLLAIREQVTVALMADYTLGLSYVIGIAEDTAEEPKFSTDGDQPLGSQVLNWSVVYRRSLTNPGA